MDDFRQSYGFDVITAPVQQIKARAMELCDEYAAKYDGDRPGDDIKRQTFEALKRMWNNQPA